MQVHGVCHRLTQRLLAKFATPAPTDTPLYLRYAAAGTNNCGRRYLSEKDGPDPGNSCQSTGAHLTLAGQSFMRDWPAGEEVALPLTSTLPATSPERSTSPAR